MAAWDAYPPRGGPLIKVKGYPGPLYPSDHPQGPSPDSDFVVAMKRTLGRIGAWPWDPNGWDDSYSLWFAHGDGWGHPTHAGIEGVQHWGAISETGNVGEKTFNFLRSVKIGQGLPHAGEMAMDSVCVNLINAAYEDAQEPTSTKTVREAALARALAEVGSKESPPGSNVTHYGEWYGEPGVPWCAIFVTWAYEHGADDVNKDCPSFLSLADSAGNNDRWDYVPWIVSDARNGRFGLSVTTSPRPGDLVCFDWNWNSEHDHVGMVVEPPDADGVFRSVEGNTSTSDNSNGGEVMKRTRNLDAQGTVFVRVSEP